VLAGVTADALGVPAAIWLVCAVTFASGVVVAIRGAWHVGLLVGGLPAYGILMVWIHERTGSLPLMMLMHVSLTASTLILTPAGISGAPLLVYDAVSSAAWWVVVAVVAVIGHHDTVLRTPVGGENAPSRR
jgi:hypothetical protein